MFWNRMPKTAVPEDAGAATGKEVAAAAEA